MASLGYDCTMLDFSRVALTVGVGNFKKWNLDGHFVLGDILHMPVRDGSFDVLYIGGVLGVFDDVGPAIREMVRVIRPGGVLAASEPLKRFSCQTPFNSAVFLARLIRNLPLVGRKGIRGIIEDSSTRPRLHRNVRPLSVYKECFAQSGVKVLFASAVCPFPFLPLPGPLDIWYAKLMKALLPFWKMFDSSPNKATEIWGLQYVIWGVKE